MLLGPTTCMGHQEVQNSSMPLGSRDHQGGTPHDQGRWRAPWATQCRMAQAQVCRPVPSPATPVWMAVSAKRSRKRYFEWVPAWTRWATHRRRPHPTASRKLGQLFPATSPGCRIGKRSGMGVNLETLSIHPEATELTPERSYSTGGGQTHI